LIAMTWLRTLKHMGARWMPEAFKSAVRGRLYGYRPARASIEFRVEKLSESVTRLHLAGLPPLWVNNAALPGFLYNLDVNGESMEELFGFAEFARAGSGVLYDVGANNGMFSLLFCAANPESRAVAFEASAAPLAALTQMAIENGLGDRITSRGVWVGDHAGEIAGHVENSGYFTHSGSPLDTRTVARTTVDLEVEHTGLVPTALKIDVEGGELTVLQGAERTLRSARPVIFLEFHQDLIERAGGSPRLVIELLVAAGYRLTTPLGEPLRPLAVIRGTAAVRRLVATPRIGTL
jgi:FkbM family methyltransferase